MVPLLDHFPLNLNVRNYSPCVWITLFFSDFRLICNWPSAKQKRPDWKKYFSTFYCVLCIIVGSQIFWIYWQNPVGVKAAYLTQHCLGTRESGDAGCAVRMKPLYLEFCGGFVNWAEIKSIDPVLRPCLVFAIPPNIYICSEKLELIISQGCPCSHTLAQREAIKSCRAAWRKKI